MNYHPDWWRWTWFQFFRLPKYNHFGRVSALGTRICTGQVVYQMDQAEHSGPQEVYPPADSICGPGIPQVWQLQGV